jgi:hypothetical protein
MHRIKKALVVTGSAALLGAMGLAAPAVASASDVQASSGHSVTSYSQDYSKDKGKDYSKDKGKGGYDKDKGKGGYDKDKGKGGYDKDKGKGGYDKKPGPVRP